MEKMNPCDYLLVCATDVERESLLSEGGPWQRFMGSNNVYYEFSNFLHTRVRLVQCQMGSGGPGGSLITVEEAIRECKPGHIIMAGIAFGMDAKKSEIGQVLVAKQYKAYDPERIGQDGSIDRGVSPPSHRNIQQLFTAASRYFTPLPIFGLMLSGSKLIDNEAYKEDLRNRAPEAIGGDMEIDGMVIAANDAGIPWGAAKAVCDFADGNKRNNKEENQKMAAMASARFVIKAIRFSEEPHTDQSLIKKIEDLGLVDIALRREKLTWSPLAKTLDDLIDSMQPRSEFFIVARSLEMWTRPQAGQTETYLEKLARKVVADKLNCIFVLPENNPDLKSLVLSDPSQKFQVYLWQRITTPLRNIIDSVAESDDVADLDHGYVEIYTIPAYVPSTFSKISTKGGVEYCSFEVGIGIPPDEDRVYLYFENKGDAPCIYERLCTIYRNIIAERKPEYKFPSWKNKPPEDPAVLSIEYSFIREEFIKDGFRDSYCVENRDWYSRDGNIYDGYAACITTLPLTNYIGGDKLSQQISNLRQDLKFKISGYPSEHEKFIWVSEEDLNIPIVYYKSGFAGRFTFPSDVSEVVELVSCISSHAPFQIEFKHFIINRFGVMMLLGVPCISKTENTLSELRYDLLKLAKIKYKRYEAMRPHIISCVIGIITNDLDRRLLSDLKNFVQEKFFIPVSIEIEIDQLRLVQLTGTYKKQNIEQLLKPIVLKTDILERDRSEKYGVITTGKWLSHSQVVEKVKRCAFRDITPITVHFSPSLNCIYNCPICSYGASKDRSNSSAGMMSRKNMLSAIDKLSLSGLKGLIFTGGGEPLTNPYTAEAIIYAKRKRFSVGLFTNGYLLTPQISEKLLSDKDSPDFIRVSINAGTNGAYRQIHGCSLNSFSTVLDNLSAACDTKMRLAAETRIDIGVLVTPALLDNLIDLAIEIKRVALKHPGAINSVLFRPAIRYHNGCRENNFAQELIDHTKQGFEFKKFIKDREQFSQLIFEEAMTIIGKQVRPLLMDNSDPSSRVNVYFPETRFDMVNQDVADRQFRHCLACNLVIFVAPDTSVYRCVEQALDPALRLGKLKDVDTFTELWQKKNLEKTVPALGLCPPVCLLYETNLVWDRIYQEYQDNPERLGHRIDIAREYFDNHVLPRIGALANFI